VRQTEHTRNTSWGETGATTVHNQNWSHHNIYYIILYIHKMMYNIIACGPDNMHKNSAMRAEYMLCLYQLKI
jgi:hypothetical protein